MKPERWDSCLGLFDNETPKTDRMASNAANQASINLEGSSQEQKACTKNSLSSRHSKQTNKRFSKFSKAHKKDHE
jgi:hypothetical protein